MTQALVVRLAPATAAAIAGMNARQINEAADFIEEEVCQMRAVAAGLDANELYLPGLELPVPLPPEALN